MLEEAGLPEGVLHVLPGGGDAGSALVEDPNNQVISFTGSTPAGRSIGEAAGRLLKGSRSSSERTIRSSFSRTPTSRLAATAGVFGSFIHQGQICMASGRHLVHESIASQYVEALTRKASALRVGDPFEHAIQVGSRLQAGALHMNDVTVNDEAVAPFPAIKASGNQTAFGGPADASEFTRWQWTTIRETPNPIPLGGA